MATRLLLAALLAAIHFTSTASARTEQIAADPYRGAIVINAADGAVLFEDNADAIGYPASVLKLMTLLLVVEKVDAGAVRLGERVRIGAEASRMGGSQVYLKEGETFTIDELLDALMIQSANDAAVALAQHIAGTREAFVRMMNQKAAALGMNNTRFISEHGLPPGADKTPDVTTARDLARLGRALLAHPLVFRYTAIKERGFRNDAFIMRNHNNLLGEVEGVDGFKTGYFRAAGYSILATAQRNGVRIIAAVLGSTSRQLRDQKTRELLAAGFLAVPPPAPAPPPPAAPAAVETAPAEPAPEVPETDRQTWWRWPLGILIFIAIGYLAYLRLSRPRDLKKDLLKR